MHGPKLSTPPRLYLLLPVQRTPANPSFISGSAISITVPAFLPSVPPFSSPCHYQLLEWGHATISSCCHLHSGTVTSGSAVEFHFEDNPLFRSKEESSRMIVKVHDHKSRVSLHCRLQAKSRKKKRKSEKLGTDRRKRKRRSRRESLH